MQSRWCGLWFTLLLRRLPFVPQSETSVPGSQVGVGVCVCAQLRLILTTPQTAAHQEIHGISQVRMMEWAAVSYSKESSQPKDQTCISWHW